MFYSYNCISSSNIYFSQDMNNCQECIFSCNQFNSSYVIFNIQYSKEEYLKHKKEILEQLNNQKQFDFLVDKYRKFLDKNYISESVNINNCE